MIVREVRLTEEAESDVENIYSYIADNSGIAAAERVWQALENC